MPVKMFVVSNLPSIAGSLGRMAGKRAASNRILRALWSAGSATAHSLGRIVRVLFLQVTGLLFVFLTLGFGGAALREYHKYKLGTTPAYKATLAASFAVMFLWFGVSSFWRAGRKRA